MFSARHWCIWRDHKARYRKKWQVTEACGCTLSSKLVVDSDVRTEGYGIQANRQRPTQAKHGNVVCRIEVLKDPCLAGSAWPSTAYTRHSNHATFAIGHAMQSSQRKAIRDSEHGPQLVALGAAQAADSKGHCD
jgi:hypothetical protein